MPSSTSGFTGQEISSYVISFFGNQSADFATFLTTVIPLAEIRFCKAHDWNFLNKINLPLTVVSGTLEYTLDSGTVGYYIAASDVRDVFSQTNGIYLGKTTLDKVRRMDPDENDGSTGQKLTNWCETGDNKIMVYPPVFSDTTLRVDGKITPTALFTLSNYPTIPLRYQNTFIDYVLAVAALRENDDRATAMMQAVKLQLREDIAADLSNLGSTDEPRIRSMNERRLDGVSPQPDPLNMLFNPFT